MRNGVPERMREGVPKQLALFPLDVSQVASRIYCVSIYTTATIYRAISPILPIPNPKIGQELVMQVNHFS